MKWYEAMVEANVLRGVFILIVVWGYYEAWRLNKLIGNRRLAAFLWKVALSIFLWVISSFVAVFIQYEWDLESRVLASLPTFLFFGFIAGSIRHRRKLLADTWREEQAEGNEILNDVLDVLEIEKVKAIREIERGK